MRHLEVSVRVPGQQAADLYARLCDFARYPELTDAVRSVHVAPAARGRSLSSWEVDFLGGILRWTQEDQFQPEARTIRFEQIDGDMDHFAGAWIIRDDGGECVIQFTCDFDLGLPAVDDYLDPVADKALRGNVRSIVMGVTGGRAELTQDVPPAGSGDAWSGLDSR